MLCCLSLFMSLGCCAAQGLVRDLKTLTAPFGLRIEGKTPGVQSGSSVSGLGDVNGDRIDDVVVGSVSAAPAAITNAPRPNAGASYVVFGRKGSKGIGSYSNIDLTTFKVGNVLGFSIYGAIAGDRSGHAVGAAGDVNGDGIKDIIVGSLYASPVVSGPDRTIAGAAYVIFGRNISAGAASYVNIDLATFTTGSPLGFRIIGAAGGDLCGYSVSGAGDVNGDHVDDVIVGAMGATPVDGFGAERPQAGISYVIFGRNTSQGANAYTNIDLITFTTGSQLGFSILGALDSSNNGVSVSTAGDVNNDGVADVIVGAPSDYAYVNGVYRMNSGVAYVIFGRRASIGPSSYTNIDLITFTTGSVLGFALMGASDLDACGCSVSTAGDFNNDGISDVIVGAKKADPVVSGGFRNDAGISYVIFGRSFTEGVKSYENIDLAMFTSGTETLGFAILGAAEDDTSGNMVSAAGDVNGDSISDVIVGSLYADSAVGREEAGIAYIVFSSLTNGGIYANIDLNPSAGSNRVFSILGASPNDIAGSSVSKAGDVNGDGKPDIIVGAYGAHNSAGSAYILFSDVSAFPTSRPSSQPSGQPSRQPSMQPSRQPSAQPTVRPSRQPSGQPSSQPSRQPVSSPTGQPSGRPSSQPSMQPSGQPSSQPVGAPTAQPSEQPSSQPTMQPTMQPSSQPSTQPSMQPTSHPSTQPSAQPSVQPSSQPSSQPSTQPSVQPSTQPSMQPLSQPSGQPSGQPSVQPSGQPTSQPSTQPSMQPSVQPTSVPTRQPSSRPTVQPSSAPSTQPTTQPSSAPSVQPSVQPSIQPTSKPSTQPTRQPSGRPSVQPTSSPSSQPSTQPSRQPSSTPSSRPTAQPSSRPTVLPTSNPSMQPSAQPSVQPSSAPSCVPTTQPTAQPSTQPTSGPSAQPSEDPTVSPSSQPSGVPSAQPSHRPSSQPSNLPSAQPTGRPSGQPSAQPSQQPRGAPTAQPSGDPSALPTLAFTGEWATVVSQNTLLLSTVSNVNMFVWGCGATLNRKSAYCVLAESSTGALVTQYRFDWDSVMSVFSTSTAPKVVINARATEGTVMNSDIATCAVQGNLHCTVTSLLDVHFLAASYVPYPNKIVYVGWYNVHTSIIIVDIPTGNIRSHIYTVFNVKGLKLSQVQSPPYFVGSFVAGTAIRATAAPVNYIVAGMYRTESGVLSAMIMSPVSGDILNSVDLVNAMALENTGPDSFIAGGLQLTDDEDMHAYLLRSNALFASVQYCVRYRSSGSGRRVLSTTSVSSSVVRGMVLVDTTLFMIIDSTHHNTTTLSVLKTSAVDGAIIKQVQVSAPNVHLHCNDIASSGLLLNIVCTYNNASVLLSVDLKLSFTVLPVGFVRGEEVIFHEENIPFQRKILAVSKTNTVIAKSNYEFTVSDQGPTRRPSLAPSATPSLQPSSAPSAQPSSSPTVEPTVSARPTSQPSSAVPTVSHKPSTDPTRKPTGKPSVASTARPSTNPTLQPSARPTETPTVQPTVKPSSTPTVCPTRLPSVKPTNTPSRHPTVLSGREPSVSPSSVMDDVSAAQRGSSVPAHVVGASVGAGLVALLIGYVVYRYFQSVAEAKAKEERREKFHATQAALSEQARLETAKFLQREADHKLARRRVKRNKRAIEVLRDESDSSYGVSVSGAFATGPVRTAHMPLSPSRHPSRSSSASLNISSMHSSELSDSQSRHPVDAMHRGAVRTAEDSESGDSDRSDGDNSDESDMNSSSRDSSVYSSD